MAMLFPSISWHVLPQYLFLSKKLPNSPPLLPSSPSHQMCQYPRGQVEALLLLLLSRFSRVIPKNFLKYLLYKCLLNDAAAAAKSCQSCLTLCDPIDGSPPGLSVPGILQARTLEWVAISFSNAWKWKVKVKSLSHVRFIMTPWTIAHQAPLPMGFSRQECWSGAPSPSPYLMMRRVLSLFCCNAADSESPGCYYLVCFSLVTSYRSYMGFKLRGNDYFW